METGKIGRLLHCASRGDIPGLRMLLDEGLPVDSADYDGRTALHLAASEGKGEVVQFLLERRANVNPVDRWRKTVKWRPDSQCSQSYIGFVPLL
jgi:ankyrin repeat protein